MTNLSAVSVRYATVSDAEAIAEMSRQTFYETFEDQNTRENMDRFMEEQFSMEKLMAEVSAPGNTFLMAFVNELPAGYVRIREGKTPPELGPQPSMEIARIYAVSSFVGKGVGSALMQKCIDIAQERKKKVIWLGVWENNLPAIQFYTKWGFTKFSNHVFLLGDDPQNDWLMKKELT